MAEEWLSQGSRIPAICFAGHWTAYALHDLDKDADGGTFVRTLLSMKKIAKAILVAAVLGVIAVCAWLLCYHGPTSYVQIHYNKYELRISMRDGVRLLTAVYVPKDTSYKYPLLVTRTPFSVAPYGKNRFPPHVGPSDAFERAGYIFVLQGVRGRYQSEGSFADAALI